MRYLLLIILIVPHTIYSQYLTNGSFEGTICIGGCTESCIAGGCPASSAPPWIRCSSSPDIVGNVNTCFNIPAIDGQTYLGFGFSAGPPGERIGQKLEDTLKPTVKYLLSGYFLEFQNICWSAFDTTDYFFQVWLGNDSCVADTLALEIQVNNINAFEYLEGSFEVFQNYTWITLGTRNASGTGKKYMMADALNLIKDPGTSISPYNKDKISHKEIKVNIR